MQGLDERLSLLYQLVPSCHCVADIGTDHGYLPLELVQSGKCDMAIACDISIGSLQKAVRHSKQRMISLDCRVSDGLDALQAKEADCIVIAGMGGILISEILERGREKIEDAILVLQPMTAVKELREYLCGHGFSIITEEMVFQEEKLYHCIVAKLGKMTYPYDCEFGSLLKGHPLYGRYLVLRKQQELDILKQMGAYRGVEYEIHRSLLKRMEQEEAQWQQATKSERL